MYKKKNPPPHTQVYFQGTEPPNKLGKFKNIVNSETNSREWVVSSEMGPGSLD